MSRLSAKIFVLSFLIISMMALVSGAVAAEDRSSFSILEAREKGTFNIGPAVGDVVSKLEKTANKEVLVFDYSIFKGAIIGVWTKEFPPELKAGAADAVKIAVMAPKPEQLEQISVKVEIKGTKDMQSIPLRLNSGWNYIREPINWNTIGSLREVVFVVSPIQVNPTAGDPMWWFSAMTTSSTGGSKKLDGILYFDLDFYRLPILQKHFTSIKYGLIFLLSLIIALFAGLIETIFVPHRTPSPIRGISRGRDLIYGIVAVLIIGCGLSIHSMGAMRFLDAGINFDFLTIGLIGAVIAQILKKTLTGRSLTSVEVFLNIALSGFLAASSSRQAVLQAPSTWAQVLMLSNTIAALTFVIYHVANSCSLASGGKHLRGITGALIVGTPYLFNWLLLLENVGIPLKIGNFLTAHTLAAWPAGLGIIVRLILQDVQGPSLYFFCLPCNCLVP